MTDAPKNDELDPAQLLGDGGEPGSDAPPS